MSRMPAQCRSTGGCNQGRAPCRTPMHCSGSTAFADSAIEAFRVLPSGGLPVTFTGSEPAELDIPTGYSLGALVLSFIAGGALALLVVSFPSLKALIP